MWRVDDPQGAESLKVKFDVVPYVRGRLLDVGAGPFKIFPYAISVDNYDHANKFGWDYKPDVIADASNLSMFASEAIDSVFSSHTLEHVETPEKVLREWWRVVKTGGHLVLYLPHKELYPNIGQEGANPDHKHDFLPDDITGLMEGLGSWDLVVNEKRDNDFGPGSSVNEYSFLQVYKKTVAGQKFSHRKEKPKKTAYVCRYGGIGDMIQASSILPRLKEQGYHVVFNTTPSGMEVLKADPHIDEFLLQDKDQVPNGELSAFWEVMKRKHTKFINLSETVEGTLLALPGRTVHYWSKEARHKVCNVNYLELTHTIAGVDEVYNARFYPTHEEKEWAFKELANIGGNLTVCFSLNGSSLHKAWPHLDQAIARLLATFPDCRIVLMGGPESVMLEAGWENEPRVLRRSGVWNIRQSLTFVCKNADLVIGPETGLLNAVGMENVAKVCFLSHSTKENLTKHWKNVVALAPPPTVTCYPCHMMHYNWEFCRPIDGVAECQLAINIDVAWAAMLGILKKTNMLEKAPPMAVNQ